MTQSLSIHALGQSRPISKLRRVSTESLGLAALRCLTGRIIFEICNPKTYLITATQSRYSMTRRQRKWPSSNWPHSRKNKGSIEKQIPMIKRFLSHTVWPYSPTGWREQGIECDYDESCIDLNICYIIWSSKSLECCFKNKCVF